MLPIFLTCTTFLLIPLVIAQCPYYADYANYLHGPFTETRWNLSYQRPIPSCRTYQLPEVEETIERMRSVIVDPDLFRLFENTWPNTLDTTIAWHGFANTTSNTTTSDDDNDDDEELTFVVTGDITAMWLRDSAQQLLSYVSLLSANSSTESLAGLWRGAINLQARYILEAPYCNAFQAPVESGIKQVNQANSDRISPSFDWWKVFSCNWELDSLASFLQLSWEYFERTGDAGFFAKFRWIEAVELVLGTAGDMMVGSYDVDGTWVHAPYSYCAPYGGTPINDCNGSPVRSGTGMVRSFHRPSDDACIYQFLVPSNMVFATYLGAAAEIMEKVNRGDDTAERMRRMSRGIRRGIEKYAVVRDPDYGDVYAYEVDGYGSANMMDDPNIPSLLSAPFLGYLDLNDKIYQNTRRKILSKDSPYFSWGPVISTVGSPHTLPGRAWPMASIMTILTSQDDEEIVRNLRDLVGSTAQLGLMHESISSQHEYLWSRQWFAWGNGLLGQAILELEKTRPHILKMGFQ